MILILCTLTANVQLFGNSDSMEKHVITINDQVSKTDELLIEGIPKSQMEFLLAYFCTQACL